MLFFWSWVFFFSGSNSDLFSVDLKPLDIQPHGEMYRLSAIHQLESDGQLLYLRSLSEARILVIDATGKMLLELGGKGMGPGEWGQDGVQAMAVHGDEVWGIGTHRLKMHGFKAGSLFHSFDVHQLRPGHQGATANVFAISAEYFVVASPFHTTYLAEVFTRSGDRNTQIGSRPVAQADGSASHPFANDTMWLHDGQRWIALFKFLPLIAVFDENFENETFINLQHPWVNKAYSHTSGDHGADVVLPLFSDVKLFGEHLYVMCRGRLLKLSLVDFKVLSETRFIGRGEAFGPIAGKPVTLPFFTFLANGTLVLAHPMGLWQHDLWQVDKAALSHFGPNAGP